jgi:hypothetical protein
VPAARPLLELDAGHEPAEGVTFVAGERLAEHREDRHVDRSRDLFDAFLQPLGLIAHHLVPVAEDEVLADFLRGEYLGSHRLGDAVKPHALLERLERLGEARAAQRRPEALDQLDERNQIHREVDGDGAPSRIRGRVDHCHSAGHRMPDHHGVVHAQPHDELVDQGRHIGEVAGRAGAVALSGEVDSEAAHVVAEPFDDRSPGAALERQPREQHDRHAGTVALEGQAHLP